MPTETQPSTMNSRLMTILGVAVLIYLSFMLGSIMSTKYEFDFSLVVPGETEEQELIIVVVAGQVTDLGELRIDWP